MNMFATLENSMHGRIQSIIRGYIISSQKMKDEDVITERGPCEIINDNCQHQIINNIKARLDISIDINKSNYIAMDGHHDCAGIYEDDETQRRYILNYA